MTTETVYKVRYKNGQFVGPGMRLYGPAKIWPKLSSARNAISQACKDGNSRKEYYQIIECSLNEVGVVK